MKCVILLNDLLYDAFYGILQNSYLPLVYAENVLFLLC